MGFRLELGGWQNLGKQAEKLIFPTGLLFKAVG